MGGVSILLGALASNTVLIAGLFGAYGAKMTGEMMERYEKEVEDFRFLPIRHSLADKNTGQSRPSASRTTSEAEEKRHKLRVAIGISGSGCEANRTKLRVARKSHRIVRICVMAMGGQWNLSAWKRLRMPSRSRSGCHTKRRS